MNRTNNSHPCPPACQCGRHAKPKSEASPNWAGDRIGYKGKHNRVIQARGAARTHRCLFHAERGVTVAALDWAQIHETDGLHRADYSPLCRRCHLRYDAAARAHLTPAVRAAMARAGWATRRTREALTGGEPR